MNQDAPAGMPDLSGAISKIMEHPELLSMVASVLGEQKGENADEPKIETADSSPPSAPPPDMLASVMPVISRLSSIGSGGSCRHEQLLCALKPYISPSRSEAIDYIIKISKMSTLLKGINPSVK